MRALKCHQVVMAGQKHHKGGSSDGEGSLMGRAIGRLKVRHIELCNNAEMESLELVCLPTSIGV